MLTNTLTPILEDAKTWKYFNSILQPFSHLHLYATAVPYLILYKCLNPKRHDEMIAEYSKIHFHLPAY